MKRIAMILATTFALLSAQVFASDAMSTETTTIGELLDNPDSKAVLDTHLPGFADNPQIEMARGMTLRFVAPMSGGMVSDEAMDAIDTDLQALAEK